MTAAQLAALFRGRTAFARPPVSAPAAPIATTLSVPRTDTWLANDDQAIPGTGTKRWAATSAQGTGDGSSKANASVDLQAMLTASVSGDSVVALGGFYDRANGVTIPTGVNLMGEPEGDGGTAAIISANEEFKEFRDDPANSWTVEDATEKIYKSVNTFANPGDILYGAWEEFGHKFYLVPYRSLADLQAAYQSFTNSTEADVGGYLGPGAYLDADGFVYIRMRKPHPVNCGYQDPWDADKTFYAQIDGAAVDGSGHLNYPVSEDPRDYKIHLSRGGQTCFNIGENCTIGSGINSTGYDRTVSVNVDGTRIKRGLHHSYRFGMQITAGVQRDWYAKRTRFTSGSMRHLQRDLFKFPENDPKAYLISERGAFLEHNSQPDVQNWTFDNCLIHGFHELCVGPTVEDWRFFMWRCTAADILDDGFQSSCQNQRFALGECWFVNAALGGNSGSSSAPVAFGAQSFIFGCVFDSRYIKMDGYGGKGDNSHHRYGFPWLNHSATGPQPRKFYNNTFLSGTEYEDTGPVGLQHNANQLNDDATWHEAFSNIVVRFSDRHFAVENSGNEVQRDAACDRIKSPNDVGDESNEKWDYNHYYRDVPDPPIEAFLQVGKKGSSKDFTSVADMNATFADLEPNGTDGDPSMPCVTDPAGSRWEYRPASGGVLDVGLDVDANGGSLNSEDWWTTPPWTPLHISWPATLKPRPFKGALDPQGTNLVGVQGDTDPPDTSDAYAQTVLGLGPLAYWRLSDANTLEDAVASRDGTFVGSPSLVSGLPANSDQALSFPGDVHGAVADDAGLHLAAFSLSGWLRVDGTPTAKIAVWSKDASGLNDGDFALTIDEELSLGAQFQDVSAEHAVATDINLGATHHWVVVAGAFGFDFFLDGKHVGRNTGFTAGWTNNDKAIQFAKAPWTTEEFVGVLDEVPLFDFQLTDANVITLSQVTSAPVAPEPLLVVTESSVITFDPFAASACVGRKTSLVVELWDGGTWVTSITTTHGSALVDGNGDIEYTAGAVTQNETDSFDYRITDANGTSANATITVNVNDSADAGGGTLVWEWQISEAQAQSWIDGVALSGRDYDDVLGGDVFYPTTGGQPSPNRWVDATTFLHADAAGPTVWKRSNNASSHYREMCWNRAPDGSPALELYTDSGHHGVADFWLELFNPSDGNGPKHLRVVMEVKTCKAADPTTHKGDGVGTTSGSYPDFQDSHSSAQDDVAMKYFCQLTQGPIPRGSALTSYWNGNNDREINGIGHMMQTGSGSKILKIYSPAWDRPNAGGVLSDQLVTESGFDLNEPGMQGEWHKLEIEVKLTDPLLVPTDDSGTRNNVFERPTGGDGETWVYATPDIDGALGSPGQRQLVQYADGQIMSPSQDEIGSDDNMHTLLNLTGPWVNFYYGGSGVSQSEAWAWIRKIQVYRHD